MTAPPPPRTMDEAMLYVTALIETLTEADYCSSVRAADQEWDVYRRKDWNGVLHTIAFRMEREAVVIGVVMPFLIGDAKVVDLIERDCHGDMSIAMGKRPMVKRPGQN